MEFAAGGDLSDFVRQRRGLSEELARWFFQQLIIAVDYTHRMVGAAAAPAHPCRPRRRCRCSVDHIWGPPQRQHAPRP